MANVRLTPAMIDAAMEATATKHDASRTSLFRRGDFVVYPTHGVGKVERIGLEEIAGHQLHLIHITFDENRMTLRVPVTKAYETGLRELATRQQLDGALEVLRGRAKVNRMMWSKRSMEYMAKVNSGDLVALSEVVRDLWTEDTANASHSARTILEIAIDRLAAEFAAIHAVSRLDAINQLSQILLDGRSDRRTATLERAGIILEA
jgi:CarD family transcriptional regulator